MPRYRNISGQDLHVSVPDKGLVGVRDGEVIEIPEIDGLYVQTGEQGEKPLFEALSTGKSTPKE